MKNFVLIVSILLAGAGNLFAKECPEPELQTQDFSRLPFTVPGEFKCIYKGCYYTPKVLDVGKLIEATKFNYRGKRGLLSEGDVKLGRDNNELALAHPCPSELELLMKIVKESDSINLLSGRRKIQMVLKIYHIENGSFKDFSFGLTGLTDGEVGDDKPARGTLDAIPNGFDLNFAFGNLTNNLLSFNLNRSRKLSRSYEVRDVPLEFLEGEHINRPVVRTEYLSDSDVGDPTTEVSGYHLRGRLYVDDSNEEDPVVIMKDLHLFYGIPQPDNPRVLVETLNIRRQEIAIPRGRPYLLNAESLSFVGTDRSNGLPIHYGKSHIRRDSKLIIFIQAWPKDNPPPEKDVNLVPLTEKQKARLKDKTDVDILKSAEFSVLSTQGESEFDLIQFNLDEAGLTKNNYDDFIYVDVKAPGLKNLPQLEFEAQHLVNGKIQLPSLLGANNGATAVDVTVTLSWENRNSAQKGMRRKNVYKLEHRLTSKRVLVKKGN